MIDNYTVSDAFIQLAKMLRNNETPTSDEQIFSENIKKEIGDRDVEYTNLLKHFLHITKIRNVLKEIFKWSFYIAIIVFIIWLMIVISKLFNTIILKADIEQIIEAVPLFITAIVGLVSVIIAIPIAVTKYLFSTKEDKNITKIILHTQEHDTSGRQWALELKKIVSAINDESKKNFEKNQ